MTSTDPGVAPPSPGPSGSPEPPRTRRRGAVLERAILDAAWDEIVDVGYNEVTMTSVAARAGTNKAALYRRWPNRTELLTAAIDRRVAHLDRRSVDTGSFRTDAIGVLEAMLRRCRNTSAVPDPTGELAAYVRRRAAADAFDEMADVLDRAADRDEIPREISHPLIARLPVDVLYSELVLADECDGQRITDIVDHLLLPLVST